jgi:membrane-bound lytic murein transglycosylase F
VVTDENDLKKCTDFLKSGDYDIIANMMPQTTESKSQLAFSQPLLTSRLMLVQTQDSNQVIDHFKLEGCTIYIPYNSPHKTRLEHLSNEVAVDFQIKEVKNKTIEQLVEDVSKKKIRYTICDELLARKLKTKFPNIDVSLPISFTEQMSWAVNPKSQRLLNELNDFINEFIGSTAYWETYRKYY